MFKQPGELQDPTRSQSLLPGPGHGGGATCWAASPHVPRAPAYPYRAGLALDISFLPSRRFSPLSTG